MLGRILCTKCTLHSNHRLTVWYSNTQNDFSLWAAIFSLHTLASPSGRNVDYDENQLNGKRNLSFSFYLYRFLKYVTFGVRKIFFCNPGVHYETPCIVVYWRYIIHYINLLPHNGMTSVKFSSKIKQPLQGLNSYIYSLSSSGAANWTHILKRILFVRFRLSQNISLYNPDYFFSVI